MTNRNRGKKRIFIVIWVILLFLFANSVIVFGPLAYKSAKIFFNRIVYNASINKENLTSIPIVVAFNNDYIYPSLVCLSSLLDSSDGDTFYDIYFFISDEFDEKNKSKILQLKDIFFNFKANFVNLNEKKEIFDNIEVYGDFSKEMFYRLVIQDVLLNFEKCIYIDVDTVVKKDLKPLYFQDVDDFYIAAVPDGTRSEPQLTESKEEYNKKIAERKKYSDSLNLPNLKNFINSGVIVWNLKKCREDDLGRKFSDFIKKNQQKEDLLLCDQDAINAVCNGKIKDLPFYFNSQTYFYLHKTYEEMLPSLVNSSYIFTKEEWDIARFDPSIIHFAYKKPWNQFDIYFAEKWWKSAKKNIFWEEILNKYIFKNDLI
ncbi:MAG: glycosyltransferase family 8 protein [Oscillospiraceae bacterium]|nr:glycosyltransferase family 8 protein [Oscillospiraceae bacterium]